ncbi:MAG: DUF5668 domain-containing protein [Chloroflexota bacterium]
MQAKGSRGPVVWPLMLTLVGIVLLLDNFLLIPLNTAALWPLLLVVAGAVLLLRGDFTPDDSVRTFGITRGSVEAALLEINAGEIDTRIGPLEREGRLIAGQYAADARPSLDVNDTYAHLRMDRAATPWMTFADWELGLAADLPWQFAISTSVGDVELDLTDLYIEGGVVATGFGDIRVNIPAETLSPLELRSATGNIRIAAPLGAKLRVRAEGARWFKVHYDERRYTEPEPGLYVARDAEPDAPLVDIDVRGTFGDAYLT